MFISKKRIRSIDPYIKNQRISEKVVVSVRIEDEKKKGLLRQIGFDGGLHAGDTVLPSVVGPVSERNAEGEIVKLKDQPKETAYREVEWHWTEWNGDQQSKFVDVPYKRYPRKIISPQGVELSIAKTGDKDILLVSPVMSVAAGKDLIVHTINLFLEIFGECELLDQNLLGFTSAPLKRLNWKVLPPGERPWKKLKEEISPLLEKVPGGNSPIVENRLETLSDKKPDFTAVGIGGFNGYIVFGFVSKNLYILESLYYGNATYIFEEDWKELSKKSKAEILNESLQKDRIIHRVSWNREIESFFKK
jgi:hypothetical protein